MRRKIGSLYQGVSLEENAPYGLTLVVVFLIRRSLFVGITFALIDQPGLQLQCFLFTSVIYLVYINTFTIFSDSFMLRLEIANETIFIIACYQMLFFSNVLPADDPYSPEQVGVSMITTITLLVGLTGLVILFTNIKVIVKKFKMKKLKGNQRKVVNEKDEPIQE